jgi:hypothetical protein
MFATIDNLSKSAALTVLALVQRKYSDFRTSDMSVEIDGPQDELIVDLTGDGNEPLGSIESHDRTIETSNKKSH